MTFFIVIVCLIGFLILRPINILPDFSVRVSFDNDLRIEFEKECNLDFNRIKDGTFYQQSYYDLKVDINRNLSSHRWRYGRY